MCGDEFDGFSLLAVEENVGLIEMENGCPHFHHPTRAAHVNGKAVNKKTIKICRSDLLMKNSA